MTDSRKSGTGKWYDRNQRIVFKWKNIQRSRDHTWHLQQRCLAVRETNGVAHNMTTQFRREKSAMPERNQLNDSPIDRSQWHTSGDNRVFLLQTIYLHEGCV